MFSNLQLREIFQRTSGHCHFCGENCVWKIMATTRAMSRLALGKPTMLFSAAKAVQIGGKLFASLRSMQSPAVA
jgi:hypothetical protein